MGTDELCPERRGVIQHCITPIHTFLQLKSCRLATAIFMMRTPQQNAYLVFGFCLFHNASLQALTFLRSYEVSCSKRMRVGGWQTDQRRTK